MKRLFYGWKMVGAGTALQLIQSGLVTQSFGAYLATLQVERGWSKTALSGAAALQQAEAAILGPILGWFLDRFGPRGVIRTGVVMLGIGLMLLSQCDELSTFYAAYLVVAFGASLCGFFPLNVALINWFERWRARALSAMSVGLALSGILVPIVAWSLQAFGWRITSFASGVFVIVVGLPLAAVIKDRPEDHGETVDGVPPAPPVTRPPGAPPPKPVRRDFTAREALRTRAFWLLGLGHSSALLAVHAVTVHAIPHMNQSLGYSVEVAALVYSLLSACVLAGVGIGWLIGDRFDKRKICAACMVMHMAGLLLLTFAVALPMVIAFAALHGIAWGLRGPFMNAIRADYFGRSAIGMIIGLSFMIVVAGQIGGPMIAGILADATGNYRVGFTVIALMSGLGSLFFMLATRPILPRGLPD